LAVVDEKNIGNNRGNDFIKLLVKLYQRFNDFNKLVKNFTIVMNKTKDINNHKEALLKDIENFKN
jgi:hypothetical protein